jgi:hypothetical protein
MFSIGKGGLMTAMGGGASKGDDLSRRHEVNADSSHSYKLKSIQPALSGAHAREERYLEGKLEIDGDVVS